MFQCIAFVMMIFIVLGMVSGFLMFWRIPSPKRVEKKNPVNKSLSIIIPARDEAGRIRPLLDSLKSQNQQVFEIIVVDDDSTDGTGDIAASYGAKVIRNEAIQDGMSGKSLACWNGAKAATGDWLLFLDADIALVQEDSLESVLASFEAEGANGIMSIQPYHKIKHTYENLSAICSVIVMTGMNAFTIFGDKLRNAGSFGPFILCDRADYFRSGGHEHIQDAIMDDLALGEAFQAQGLPVRCYGGRGIVSLRMYPDGIGQLVEGWTKNFGTASQSTHPLVMTFINIWVAGGIASPLYLLVSIFFLSLSIILYGAYMLQMLFLARWTGKFKLWVFLVYPLLLISFIVIFLTSLYLTKVRRTVTWRGRKIKV